MATGEKPVPVQRMAAIEAFTGGAVTRQSLRPHDWHQIWPELAATEPQPCMTSNNPDRIELRVELPSVDVSVLDGCCNATGRSRADVVRCILSDWSLARIHEAKVICRVAGVNPFDAEPGRK